MLEMVERRAAIYVSNCYHKRVNFSEMMDKLGWPPLALRRE
jgi:hypothetical protein